MDLYNLGGYYQTVADRGLSGSYLWGLSGSGGILGGYPAGLLSGGMTASAQIAPVYAKFTDALQKTLSQRHTFREGGDVVMSFPPKAAGGRVDESRDTADMSQEEYKKYICGKISALPVSNSCRTNCSGVLVLKEEAFVNMQKDPAYEKEVLSKLQEDFQAQYSCYAPKFGFRVIGGSAGECYGEGMTAKGSSTASDTSGAQKSRREERQEQIDLQIQARLGRQGSLADRLASNRAARFQERAAQRQEGSI